MNHPSPSLFVSLRSRLGFVNGLWGGNFFERLAFWSLVFLVATFPFGNFSQEFGAAGAILGLAGMLATSWERSALRRAPAAWLLLAFFAYVVLNVLFVSEAPSTSRKVVTGSLRMSLPIFLAALEVFSRDRSGRRLTWLTAAAAVMVFLEGLDGVWQAATGFDLVRGTPLHFGGRLTGSFSSPRVGNLMAMAIPLAGGLVFLLPAAWSWAKRLALTACALAPGVFLLVGSGTRSALFGLSVAGFALFGYFFRPSKKVVGAVLAVILAGAVGLSFFSSRGEGQLDPRFAFLWPWAVQLFQEKPVFGVGFGAYQEAYGLRQLREKANLPERDIDHPHNVYLQLASEGGAAGAVLFAAPVGLALWTVWRAFARRARLALCPYGDYYHSGADDAGLAAPGLAAPGLADPGLAARAAALACVCAGFLAYLASAVSGHSLFRSWWLTFALLLLGTALGVAQTLRNEMKEQGGGLPPDR